MRSRDVDQSRLRRVVDLLIRESGVRFEWFQVFGTGFFRRIRPVPGRARSIPTFSSVAAADRKCGPWCVRGWEPTGRSSGSHPRRENASVTPGTTSDNYFRFTAPRWKAPRTVRNHPPEHVDDICLWCDTPSMSCGTANMPHENCYVR